jgi:hypothetical protein
MAEDFRLDADELMNVVNGLRDVHSQIQEIVSTTRGQLAAEGTPWQFNGAPAGIQTHLDEAQDAADPSKPNSLGAAVGDLADYIDSAAKIFTKSDDTGLA